jgi:hypothetical protein
LIVKLVNPLKPTNMATTCPNCKTRLSCGCQTRKASNGAAVCTNCIGKFEASLKIASQNAKQTGTSPRTK